MSPRAGMENSRRVYPPLVTLMSLQLTLSGELSFWMTVSGNFVRNIDVCKLHGLQLFAALVCMVDNLCLAYRKFIALTAHILDEDGQMKLTTAGYLEASRWSQSLPHAG